VHCKTVSSILIEGGLAEMKGEMAIVVTDPLKGRAQEIINVTNEFDDNFSGQKINELLFNRGIFREENKVIRISSNIDWGGGWS
jgi:hypothetical protein